MHEHESIQVDDNILARKMVCRKQELPGDSPWNLRSLMRMAQGKVNWRLELMGEYEGGHIMQVWEEPETDKEMHARIQSHKKAEHKKAQAQTRKWDKDLQTYNKLKSKFEP